MSKEIKKSTEEFVEVNNQVTIKSIAGGKGRKLSAKNSTFNLDDGEYTATITDAFWYKTADEKDRVMIVYELDDGTEFKNSVDGDWIENYPFSVLISQGNVQYVQDFVGLHVTFKVRNTEGTEYTFSNIRQIALSK